MAGSSEGSLQTKVKKCCHLLPEYFLCLFEKHFTISKGSKKGKKSNYCKNANMQHQWESLYI